MGKSSTADLVLEAALAYAARGMKVFPCKAGSKVPVTPNGHNDATTDPEIIRAWWAQTPRANIGCNLAASGLVAVDADLYKPDCGWPAFMKGKVLPSTFTQHSARGGLHYVYTADPEERFAGKLCQGVEVKHQGYILLAPSLFEGKHYKIVVDLPPAPCPDWVPRKGKARAKTDTPPLPDWLLEIAKGDAGRGISDDPDDMQAPEPVTPHKIETALEGVPSDDQDIWLQCCCAIKHELGETGWDIFVEWSRKSPKFKGEDDCRQLWDRANYAYTAATIFYYADEFNPGWRRRYEAHEQRRAEQVAENIKIGEDIPDESIFPTVMTIEEMHKRLVFVGSTGAVIDRQTGRTRKKEAAAAEYAASVFYRKVDGRKRKLRVLNAWIESPNRLTVDAVAWWPGEKEIFRPPEEYGGFAFNTWQPLVPVEAPDDWQERVKPFLEHVDYLVPVEAERRRFLQWLAHIVQHPEVLPHTAYLMTTPTTGIGRNLMASMLVRALRGHVAAGISLPEILDGGFTGRLSRRLLAIVDEAKEGSGERRWARAERLKSLITEDHRPINPKYGHQTVEKNCCRWLMFSNHQDAIPFENTDRRIIVIANPTVRMSPGYYEAHFARLDDRVFTASIRHYLETLNLSRFKPGEHAPMNDAKRETLFAMSSEVDRLVAAFKDECETELTSRNRIQNYIRAEDDRLNVEANHLTHAITRAGMVNTGRRVKFKGQWHHVVIVRGDWKAADIRDAQAFSTQALTEIMFPGGEETI